MLYQLSYLLLYPAYNCQELINGVWTPLDSGTDEYNKKCVPSYFCDNTETMQWQRNDEDENSLDNWIKKYDMECDGSLTISLFGMMFFAGWAVSSLIFPRISDRIGRKLMFSLSILVNIIVFTLMLVLPAKKSMVPVLITLMAIEGM